MHLIVNLWSLREHMTHAGPRPWMVFDYITVNDAFGYVAWPFSFHPRLDSTKIDYSFRNERRTRTKNYNLLRAQNVSPFWLIRRFCFLCRRMTSPECIECSFFQFFGRTKVLIWTPFHPNYYIFIRMLLWRFSRGNKKNGFCVRVRKIVAFLSHFGNKCIRYQISLAKFECIFHDITLTSWKSYLLALFPFFRYSGRASAREGEQRKNCRAR